MRKGNLVKFKRDHEEVKRAIELSHVYGIPQPIRTLRPTTPEEQEEWHRQKSLDIKKAQENGVETFHIVFNDAGESRLAPSSVPVSLPVDGIYVVERARCRVNFGWGSSTGGMTKVLNTKTGESTFVKREMLEVVS